ncbi:redoxin family protein [Brevibacterium sp. 5221]|uniref:Redoxin family protein n=2 Tax=Brevibacteriaceae TaxID=85019 RepID=A0A6N9H762_9MICO|nr:redoxin family protein [Brevibacterium rongguiense]
MDRRGALGALGALGAGAGLLGLSGCSTDNDQLAKQAGSGQGYVSGDGVVTQIAPGERKEPLDLAFTLLDGKRADLKQWRPRAVVINLWYAACPPCRREAPELVKVAQKYKGRAEFLGVNVRDQKAAAQAFIDTFAIKYPVMLDADGRMVSLLSAILPPQATPSTVVLDAQGRAAARIVGRVESSTLTGVIDDALQG